MAEAALTLEISSDGVIRATGNLNKFVDEANKAAASSTSLENSADTASQSVSSLGDNAKKASDSTASLGDNAKKAADNVKKEGDSAKKTADDVKKAGDSAKKTATYTNDLNDVLKKLNNLMSMAGVGALAAGLGKAAQAVGNFAKQAMGAYSSFEQLESGLEGLTGSAEAGKALFEDLRAFSFDTTFGVDTLAGAASQLMNVGVQAGDLREQLGMLGNIAGGDTTKFNELTEIYSKIINMGKAGGEQLGQLALRGVPIQQMLQQMGVEGTASAADITEAFRRMTEAGGQFHGAMQRINDTIQGKQGFIADTWREFLTSTVEATGAADAYRAVLDTVYNMLQGVVNVLQTINKHPIVKAILQGIFAAALGALVGVILTALIPALVKTIAELSIIATLKNAINPVAGVIGLVAGAAITGGIALAGMAASAKDTADELANATDKALGYADASKGLSGKDIDSAKQNAETKGTRSTLDDQRIALDSYAKEIDDAYKASGNAGYDWRKNGAVQLDNMTGGDLMSKENYQIIVDAKKKYDEILAVYNKVVESDKRHNALLSEQGRLLREQVLTYGEMQTALKDYQDAVAKINEEWSKTTLRGQIDALKKEIARASKEINDKGRDTGKTTKTMSKAEAARNGYEEADDGSGRYIQKYDSKTIEEKTESVGAMQKQLQELNDKLLDSLVVGWRRTARDAMSLTNTDVYDVKEGHGKGGDVIAAAYLDNMNAANDRAQRAASLTGADMGNVAQKDYEKLAEVLNTLMTADLDDKNAFKETNESIKMLVEAMQKEQIESAKYEAEHGGYKENAEYAKLLQSFNDMAGTVDKTKTRLEELGYTSKDLDDALDATTKKFQETAQDAAVGAVLSNMPGEMGAFGGVAQSVYTDTMTGIRGGMGAGEAFSASMGAGNASMGIMGGGAMGAIGAAANLFVGAINDCASEVKDMDKVMNPIKTVLESVLVPAFEALAGVLEPIFHVLDGVQSVLSAIVEGALKIFQPLLNVIDGIFSRLANLFTQLFNTLDPILDILGQVVDVILNGLDAALEPLLQGFSAVASLLDIFAAIIEPITAILNAIFAVIKVLAVPLRLLGMLFKAVASAIRSFLQPFISALEKFCGWINAILGYGEEEEDQKQDEIEYLKELNTQLRSLKDAMAEQEEYYLSKRRALNAEAYSDKVTGVNDMIITPQGNFSTHPDDYIIAAKDPSILGGRSAVAVQVVVNNNSNAQVSAEQRTDASGMEKIIVNISQRVAGDLASGKNGWDGAMVAYQTRQQGRAWST